MSTHPLPNSTEASAPPPLQLRLRMALPTLRESERQVANVVLARLDQMSHLGIVEVARAAEVSEGSVMRLCRALGFPGYAAFKIQLVSDLAASAAQPHPMMFNDVHSTIAQDDDIATIVRKVFRMDMQALADTLLVLSVQQIEAAVDVLASARHVELIGVGGSSLIAQDAAFRFMRVGIAALALPDPHMQAIRAALLGPQDVLVAISHSGETPETIETCKIAASASARVIAITSVPKSTLARRADIALVTCAPDAAGRSEAIPPRIAQLTLIDAICAALSMRAEVKTANDVHKIDNALKKMRRKRS